MGRHLNWHQHVFTATAKSPQRRQRSWKLSIVLKVATFDICPHLYVFNTFPVSPPMRTSLISIEKCLVMDWLAHFTLLTHSPFLPGPHSWRVPLILSCGAFYPQMYSVHSSGWQSLQDPGLVPLSQVLPPVPSPQEPPRGPPHRSPKKLPTCLKKMLSF